MHGAVHSQLKCNSQSLFQRYVHPKQFTFSEFHRIFRRVWVRVVTLALFVNVGINLGWVILSHNQYSHAFPGLVKGNRRVRVDHLTRPSGFSDLLLDVFKRDMGTTLKDDDDLIVIAYPSFNPNEMISVRELYDADPKKRPIVVINGELDRIRTGYYPGIFYPKLIGAMKDFLPKFDQALYLHNYKGSKGGVLYRVYPEPWQVFTRRQGQRVNKVYEQETMPTTKEVALEILPKY